MSNGEKRETEESQLRVGLLRDRASSDVGRFEMIGSSVSFLAMERELRLVANWDEPVLVTGERGSGKDMAARALHLWSKRHEGPFVPIFIPALSESMLADELFGHKRGSFTGAESQRPGKFTAAEGGTVFLDEIGELTAASQAALLRVLETGEITRIGQDLPVYVDVRVVAATSKDLPVLIEQGRFRADLYDRLRVLVIDVPPLRDRLEDVPLLALYFLQRCCLKAGCPSGRPNLEFCRAESPARCATQQFYEGLMTYDWPGNIRELRDLIISLRAKHPGMILDHSLLAPLLLMKDALDSTGSNEKSDFSLETATRLHIERVLANAVTISKAARMLGLPRSTLRNKMKRLRIDSRQ